MFLLYYSWGIFFLFYFNYLVKLKTPIYLFYLHCINIWVFNFLILICVVSLAVYRLSNLYFYYIPLSLFIKFWAYNYIFIFTCQQLKFSFVPLNLLSGFFIVHPPVYYWSVVWFFYFNWIKLCGIEVYYNLVVWKNIGLWVAFFTGGMWSLLILTWSYFWVFDPVECLLTFFIIWSLIKQHTRGQVYSVIYIYLFFIYNLLALLCFRLGLLTTRHSFFSSLSTTPPLLFMLLWFFWFSIFCRSKFIGWNLQSWYFLMFFCSFGGNFVTSYFLLGITLLSYFLIYFCYSYRGGLKYFLLGGHLIVFYYIIFLLVGCSNLIYLFTDALLWGFSRSSSRYFNQIIQNYYQTYTNLGGGV